MKNISRIQNIYRTESSRIEDYLDVERKLQSDELQLQASRCMDCGIPFCHGLGCPLGNVIPDMNEAVRKNDYKAAWDILSSTSNMPEFTSRVCPALCENTCTKNIENEPVMIRQLEKAVVEKAFEMGYVTPITQKNKLNKKVAVIGAGPSGLYMAYELFKLGYNVTVYEKRKYAGGLLRYGIPDFKLEKHIIQRRIDLLTASGIKFQFNTEIGKDISAEYLKKKYDALVLAIGTPLPRDLNVEGRQLKNIHFALEFLSSQNKLIGKEIDKLEIDVKGKDVVIIGGGDTGSDCLGTSIRQKAANITQIEIMPEPPKERSASTPWPDWPYELKTSSSHKEGGTRLWAKVVKKFHGENGKVTAIDIVDAQWEFSENGRPLSFKEKEGTLQTLKADYVFIAMGFLGVDANSFVKDINLEVDKRGRVESLASQGIFTCGDMRTGQSLVVRAMTDAKNIAKNVDEYLKGL